MAFHLTSALYSTAKLWGSIVSTSKFTIANSPRIAFRQIRKIRFSGPLSTRTTARKLREQFVGFTPAMIFENKLKVGFMPVTL